MMNDRKLVDVKLVEVQKIVDAQTKVIQNPFCNVHTLIGSNDCMLCVCWGYIEGRDSVHSAASALWADLCYIFLFEEEWYDTKPVHSAQG